MINIKKKIIIIGIIIFIIAIIVIISLYIAKREFRDWIDIYILGKNITEEDISVINLDTEKTNQIHVYSKYIALLNDKNITLYNKYGEETTTINVNINTALFNSSGNYLAIAEEGGNEICVIFDKSYLWSNSIEGEILQIYVNKNGFLAVVTTDSTYKSILTVYNSSGSQLFKSYFASTRIIDVSISNDNEYVAIGELDTSGTLIQSNIKIISIKNAQSDSDNAIIYTYNANSNSLITNIKYQNNGQLICMYDDKIAIIKDEQSTDILNIEEDEDIAFVSIDFSNSIVYIDEESAGFFTTNSIIKIKNTSNNQEYIYTIEEIVKEMYVREDVLAVNIGTELYFFNTMGWLIKKYSGTQEIANFIFSSEIAAIIQKDKIIIIEL